MGNRSKSLLKKGQSLGERAILEGEPAGETCSASSPVLALSVNRQAPHITCFHVTCFNDRQTPCKAHVHCCNDCCHMLQQQAEPSYGPCLLLRCLLSHASVTGETLIRPISAVAMTAVTCFNNRQNPHMIHVHCCDDCCHIL